MEKNVIPVPVFGTERRLLAASLLEFIRGLDFSVAGQKYIDGMRNETLISAAIVIGQVERKLVCASDIWHMTGIPRPSVIRKLRQISTVRSLRALKDGSRVCYFFADVNTAEAIDGAMYRLRIAKQLCTALSTLNTITLDGIHAPGYQKLRAIVREQTGRPPDQ